MSEAKPDEIKTDEVKENETKPSETKPRKVVVRNVAIVLGIVCIILIAGLGGVMAYYTMTVNDKDNELGTLKSGIASITGGRSTSNATTLVSQLNANITNLMNEENQLQTWLDGNESLLSQTQTWLGGNITSYEAQISSLNAAINQLKDTIADQINAITSLNARITQLQTWLAGNITAYNSEVQQYNSYVADHHYTDEEYANVTNIVDLNDSTVWVPSKTVSQAAGEYTNWTESANYTGYVSVWIQSSTVLGTHVRVTYSSYGVNFYQEIVANAGNTASFPILPSLNILVQVGNGNSGSEGGATETITIAYYY